MTFVKRKLINYFFVTAIILGIGVADGAYNFSSADTGDVAIWLMNGTVLTSGPIVGTVSDSDWQIKDAGDFDGDGKADILWRNASTGEVAIWLMDGATLTSGPIVATISDLNWQIKGAGDFDGDFKADILWQNATTGQIALWLMNGTAITSSTIVATVSDLNWNIKGVGDFSGDGKSDILWRDETSAAGDIGTPGSGGGFLWKPISDGDRKLAVLLPSGYTGLTTLVLEIYKSDGTLLETGRYIKPSNGNRETYRFSMPGAGYGTDLRLVITLKDGSRHYWVIPDGAVRVG